MNRKIMIILLILLIIILILIIYPKECGSWNSWEGTDTKCTCIGKTYTPSGWYDSGPHNCIGICLRGKCITESRP